MTNRQAEQKRISDGILSLVLSVSFTAIIFFCAIFLSDELSGLVREGLLLSVNVILPSILPFLIITDLTVRFVRFERISALRGIFEKIFKVNGVAISAYLCGLLCGFPIGAKLALTLYENGNISKCECERLMIFANNASPAYVICAVGLGMRGSIVEGVILYLAVVLSSAAVGIIIGAKKEFSRNYEFISWQRYSFVESVKSSISISANVCGFVTVFAIISGAIRLVIGETALFPIVISLLEIGNSSLYLSDLHIFGDYYSLCLTAFSLAFSGLCVAAQAVSLIPAGSGISFRRYIPTKILQGVIAAVFALLLSLIVPH